LSYQAILRFYPGSDFMTAFNAEVAAQLPSFSARELATTIKGFARLNHNPGRPLLDAMARHALDILPTYSPRDAAMTLNRWVVRISDTHAPS
jgi:hypothetical protein